ncbi:MAG: transcription factor FapR [Hydrogenibacillus schlegelii]|uniref:Transcription factor FapR n=1 Tax=Hydrogenibacillus schlegelii TaxID=1484 RepID=A0A947CVS9_HYDSH|nr:transcription factor FapR [Hydrogenibacillus schlegelii]
MRLSKEARRAALQAYLRENPFVTDEALAEHFGVSVQTIRLDRAALGIPEMRDRVRAVAERLFQNVTSLAEEEFIGTLVALELDRRAASTLTITPVHTFRRSRIARGHVLFAQANALAIAVAPAPAALTRRAEIDYLAPVILGDTVEAVATVVERPKPNRRVVRVEGAVGGKPVFTGVFRVALLRAEEFTGEAEGMGRAHRR